MEIQRPTTLICYFQENTPLILTKNSNENVTKNSCVLPNYKKALSIALTTKNKLVIYENTYSGSIRLQAFIATT